MLSFATGDGDWIGLAFDWMKFGWDVSGIADASGMLIPVACWDEVRWHGMLVAWMGLG